VVLVFSEKAIKCIKVYNHLNFGYFNDDKKNGFGANFFTKKNNSFILGKWSNDQLQGLVLFFVENEIIFLQFLDNKIVKNEFTPEEKKEFTDSEGYSNLISFYEEEIQHLPSS